MSAHADVCFVDTNVLLYAVDASDPAKRARAAAWLDQLWLQGSGRLSWQVLHEFYVNATRKLGLGSGLARSTVNAFALWQPLDTTLELIQRAWIWTDRAQVPYWDALIVAAAERTEASILLSEDFQRGRRFGGCRVVDPFSQPPSAE